MTMKELPPRRDDVFNAGKLMAAVATLQRSVEHCVEGLTDVVTRLDRIETRLDHRSNDDDYELITGVTDSRELERSARTYRNRAALKELEAQEAQENFSRWKKRGLLAGAFLIGAGGALVKMVELLVQLLAK